MAKKQDLRRQRAGTIINVTSKRQEHALSLALIDVCKQLESKFPGIQLRHESQWFLPAVIANLKAAFAGVDFHHFHASSAMRPDGGILSIVSNSGPAYPILIAEKKNQGTNDLRALEGKSKQAKGNAIERLGKFVTEPEALFYSFDENKFQISKVGVAKRYLVRLGEGAWMECVQMLFTDAEKKRRTIKFIAVKDSDGKFMSLWRIPHYPNPALEKYAFKN